VAFEIAKTSYLYVMSKNLNEVIPLCIDSIYIHFIVYIYIYIYISQHNYIIKAYVKATWFGLKSHRQAKLRAINLLAPELFF
jgi:hypothetical protein